MRRRRNQKGFVLSMELIFIATILVLGLIVGWVSVRDAGVTELADVADAIAVLSQSYDWNGITGHSSSVDGSFFTDEVDFCDQGSVATTLNERCVTIAPGDPDPFNEEVVP